MGRIACFQLRTTLESVFVYELVMLYLTSTVNTEKLLITFRGKAKTC